MFGSIAETVDRFIRGHALLGRWGKKTRLERQQLA
jgi:hypothetical protein